MKAIQEWTPARAAELTILWNKGYTARKIAEMMGIAHADGRNIVIGKAHRMKLPPRRRMGHDRAEYKRMREEREALKAMRTRARKDRATRPTLPRVAVERPAPLEEPVSRNIPFSKRLSGIECAWIAGEPTAGATCCGVRCKAGSQFCPHHHARCFVKPESRAR